MPKSKHYLSFIFLILCLAACTPAGLSGEQLAQVNLEDSLIPFLEGFEEASGATSQSVWDPLPPIYDDFPAPANAFDRRFISDGQTVGGISVLLYSGTGNLLLSFQNIVAGYGTEINQEDYQYNITNLNLAEESVAALLERTVEEGRILRNTSLVFRRCHAIVELNFAHITDLQLAAEFALAIDEILTPSVCP
jgi:hypothetical protein